MSPPLNVNLIRRIAMGDTLRRRANSHAHSEALVEFIDGKRVAIDYSHLNQRVNQLVRGLREHGIKQGDRVAILGANTSQMLTALLGCFKGGFVAVPINYVQNPTDVEYNIAHSGAVAVFADATLQPLVNQVTDNIDRTFLLASLSGEATGSAINFEDVLAGQDSSEVEDIIIEDDDVAQIMYTSGTTARPKGVMLSHKNIYIATLNTVISIGANKDSTAHPAVLPLFHITAELFALVSLHLGAKVVLQNGFNPATVLALIESEKLEFAILLPLMWKAMLGCPELNQHDYSSMQVGMYGMAPMDAPTLEKLNQVFGCPFSTGSGQTEINGVSTVMDTHWVGKKKGNFWGDGAITSDQAVMDDQGNLLPPGEIGEVVWRCPQVMLGYYRNEAATREAQAFGWHHSGDIGYIDDDGQFCFVDRKKDIVKSGGENVSSVKVESCILACEGVANVGVIGLPHEHWGEAVTAVVSRKPNTQVDEQNIINHCKATLGGFETPKRVIILDELPMTATGKVKKHLLRQEYAELFNGVQK
ncbi:MAG: AMP-binding protein [Gammaproteobacteria bacterium]|nr:AMP-binding protein [Gammaproteobacteria bacterium]MBQ0840912.1 AMP-binding protein [Gammaproteobacteria bacterium]